MSEKLTPAQAKWVKDRVREILESTEVYPNTRAGVFSLVHGAYSQALDELTIKPPNPEFCEGEEE